ARAVRRENEYLTAATAIIIRQRHFRARHGVHNRRLILTTHHKKAAVWAEYSRRERTKVCNVPGDDFAGVVQVPQCPPGGIQRKRIGPWSRARLVQRRRQSAAVGTEYRRGGRPQVGAFL